MLFDGEETVGADSVSPVEAEGVEDSASHIDRRCVSKGRVQSRCCCGEQTGTESYTAEEEAAFFWTPHHRNGLESFAKKGGWRGAASRLSCLNFGSLDLKMSELLCFAFDSAKCVAIVVMKSPDQSGEVAFSVTDIVAMNLCAKGPLGPMEDVKGIATQ